MRSRSKGSVMPGKGEGSNRKRKRAAKEIWPLDLAEISHKINADNDCEWILKRFANRTRLLQRLRLKERSRLR